MPCAVTPIGRVCGTAIGIADMLITSRTPNRSTSCPTAAANRSHCDSGSGPVSSRYSVSAVSVSGDDVQVGRRVGLPVVGVEPQRGRRGPVVDELVDVEPRQRARLPPLAHRLDGQPGGVARVDEPLQRHDQHRPAARDVRLRQLVQLGGLQHRAPPSSGFA